MKIIQEWVKPLFIGLVIALTFFITSESKWVYLPHLYSIGIILYLVNVPAVVEYLPNYIERFIIISLCVAIPNYAIIFAKISSLDVRNNVKYKYTYQPDMSKDTLKILGKLGQYVIFSTFDNKRKYIKSIEKIDNFEIVDKN